MSDPIVKGVKRSPSRPASRQNPSASSAKNRTLAGKNARPKPIVKRSSSEKAPARKAPKTSAKTVSTAAAKGKTAKTLPVRKAAAPKKAAAKKAVSKKKAAPSRGQAKAVAPRRPAPPAKKAGKQPVAVKATKSRPAPTSNKTKKSSAALPARRTAAPPPPPRQPTQDEAAALRAFERAHKEFVRGRFGEARLQFRSLIEKYANVSEVTARSRTYLAIAESRLRTEMSLPRDADSLYDRGVIELNRGEYVAAQEMFERALKREPEAAHIHYGLAATRSRLGSIETALESLKRALELQPSLRVRAQHDQDLTLLRNDPEFDRLVFSSRF
jgi:tetratricopeptide (TPR) repeat protein